MLKSLKIFYSQTDPIIFWSTTLSLTLALSILTIFFLNLTNLPTELPLFFSLPWGDNQLASTTQFLLLPSIILLTLLTNLILSWHLHNSQLILKRILAIFSTLIALLITLTALKIISIFL